MTAVGPFASLPQSTGAVVGVSSASPDVSAGLDPSLIQQTKNEIRQIVQEVTQLSQSNVSHEEFMQGFLPRVVAALAAAGGAIWTTSEEGGLEIQYQINYPARVLSDNASAKTRHALLLRNVLHHAHPTLVPPQSGSPADDEAGNPTDFLLILATLKVDQQVVGVVEIFQRAGGGPTTQRGYLRFLVQMTELATDYLKSRRLRSLGDRQTLWESLERFLNTIHRNLDTQATAYALVNDSRPLIGCDRVSLALRVGKRYVVRAVSGLDSLDRRAVELKLLSRLATVVAAAGQPLWYAGEARDIPPQIEGPLQEYLDHAHSKSLTVLPLSRLTDEFEGVRKRPQRPLGMLIVEKLCDARLTEGERHRIETIALHGSTALGNALEHQSVFLLPLWRAIGRLKWIVQARAIPWTLTVTAILIGAISALCLIPADFDLAARGKLQPSIRRDVFAQIDGVVVDVPVEHEQLVEQNQVLCQLTNNDLEVQISDVLGRRRATQERVNNVQRSLLNDRRIGIEERNRLDGELLEQRQVSESLDRELALLYEKREQLCVRSRMTGQVVTWNARDTLLRRPVERGQVLLTLVDPSGPWELELYMPERRMGHIARAARDAEGGLPVTFMLTSHPGREFTGHVVEMQRTAELHSDEGNSVVLRVAVDKELLPELRSDTTVTAKVHSGSRPLGYVWFHEVWETAKRNCCSGFKVEDKRCGDCRS